MHEILKNQLASNKKWEIPREIVYPKPDDPSWEKLFDQSNDLGKTNIANCWLWQINERNGMEPLNTILKVIGENQSFFKKAYTYLDEFSLKEGPFATPLNLIKLEKNLTSEQIKLVEVLEDLLIEKELTSLLELDNTVHYFLPNGGVGVQFASLSKTVLRLLHKCLWEKMEMGDTDLLAIGLSLTTLLEVSAIAIPSSENQNKVMKSWLLLVKMATRENHVEKKALEELRAVFKEIPAAVSLPALKEVLATCIQPVENTSEERIVHRGMVHRGFVKSEVNYGMYCHPLQIMAAWFPDYQQAWAAALGLGLRFEDGCALVLQQIELENTSEPLNLPICLGKS